MRISIKGTASILCLVLVPVLLSGQQEAATGYAVPTDVKKTYSLSVSEFTGISLSSENQYLTTSIPRLIMERLQSIPTHSLTAEELSGYRKKLLFDARVKAGQEIAALVKQDAELYFNVQDPEKYVADKAEITRKLEERREYLEFLTNIDPETVQVAGEMPLTILRKKDTLLVEGSELQSEFSVADSARENESDLMITGTVEEIQGYLYFQIDLWSALAQSPLLILEDAATADGVSPLIDDLAAEIISTVLGRDWVTLRVLPEPGDAYVYVDEGLIGTGESVARYLKPGSHTILVERSGYYSETREIELRGDSTLEVAVELLPIPKAMVSVLTDPPGAGVYIGAEWRGVTPLSIEIPTKAERILLRLQGYEDFQQIVTPSDSYTLNISLRPTDSKVPTFKDYKNGFYTAFGLFSLSLPFTVGIFGLSQSYRAGVELSTNLATRTFMKNAADVYQYVYWGCLAVTGTLFINTIYRLFEYIKAGEETF